MNGFKYLAITITVSCCLLCGCETHPAREQDNGEEGFRVTDSLLNRLKIDTVKEASAASSITLSGMLAPDENKMVKIFPMVSGITENVRVQLGDHVAKGQTLASMRSVEIAGFDKDAISAEADVRNTKRIFESTQDLYKSGLASERDLEQARSDHDKATAEYKRASSVLAINKSTAHGYEIQTPISGFVVEKNITNNTQVRSDYGQNMFTIADLSTLYVLINIYESDISRVKIGDKVRITTLSYPDNTFGGTVEKMYEMIDPEKRVMQARVRIENPGNRLKPQMFANVVISGQENSNLPVINVSNIVFDNGGNFVLVRDGDAHVRVQPVTIAKRVEDRAYIESGLQTGDLIIASRQVFLYESLKK